MRPPVDPAKGRLFVVGTPIGNLRDITLRALDTLREVSLIVSEDTRRTGRLLKAYDIDTRQLPYHDHNKGRVTPELLTRLADGEDLALVTDAGTPGVADPAYYLVSRAWERGLRVVPIPGPSALTAALQAAGAPCDRFQFAGYVPRKPGRRSRLWDTMEAYERTTVVFETPHRITRTLEELGERLPDHTVYLCREMTKLHEEFLRGTAAELLESLGERKLKGEMTLLVARE